jgi:hypothetical protein
MTRVPTWTATALRISGTASIQAGPVEKEMRPMAKKSIPTAETVFALFEQLNDRERERFQELSGWMDVIRAMGDAMISDLETGQKALNLLEHNETIIKSLSETNQRMLLRIFPELVKHLQWKKWHDPPEKLSYPDIAARHERLTGDPVDEQAVRRAIKRIEKRPEV